MSNSIDPSTSVFLVTGAGSGIGQAIALRLAAEGFHVFGLGRSAEKLKATAAMLPPEFFGFASADLSSVEGCARALSEFRVWRGSRRLAGLVNNAGVFDRLGFNESSDAVWQKQFDNNLMSAVRLTRELFSELKASGSGSVLNISSTLGLRPVPMTSAYSAVKAAMVNWTEALAKEWATDGVRVNCICPGLVDTPIHSFHGVAEGSEARVQAHAAQPLGRVGTPEDIADAAWFLLSARSSWTTGAVLKVDGGISL